MGSHDSHDITDNPSADVNQPDEDLSTALHLAGKNFFFQKFMYSVKPAVDMWNVRDF